MHFLETLHRDEIADQLCRWRRAAGEQLRLVAGLDRVQKITRRPRMLIGALLDARDHVQPGAGHRFKLRLPVGQRIRRF